MRRKAELDYMSAIACLLVILIHVLSVGIVNVNPASWQAVVIYFPWRFAAFVVPMFIYNAAVKLAGQFGEADITPGVYLRYCLRRIRKIYVPYVLWVVVYYAYYLHCGYVEGSIREFLSYVWIGNLASPFYFIVIIMQFYLTMPLWMWLLNHVHPCVGTGVSLFVSLCMFEMAPLLASFGVTYPYTDRTCLTYSVFWVIGLYTGKYYDRVLPALRGRWTRLFCGAAAAVYCVLFYLEYACGVSLHNASAIKIAADCLTIVLLHAVCLRLADRPGRTADLLGKICRYSFPVYLCHCLFLTMLETNMPRLGITRLSAVLLIRALVCYTVPFLLCRILAGLRRLVLSLGKNCRYKE